MECHKKYSHPMFIHELWRQKNAKFCKWSRHQLPHRRALLHGAVTRVCYSVHLSKQFDTRKVGTLNANQWRDLYTPSKATESQLWCIRHAEKARHCFKAKYVVSIADSAIIVAFVFGASILKLTSKILFARALTQNSCFLRRVGANAACRWTTRNQHRRRW